MSNIDFSQIITAEQKQAEAQAALSDAVNAERARRILTGVSLTVTGHPQPIALQGREQDQRNLLALATAAQARIAAGYNTHQTAFRDANNELHHLVPAQIFELWSKGAAWIEAVYAASWSIKDSDSIPADFADDQYWP
jgi:hypothetical protein